MKSIANTDGFTAEDLCLKCGLCCNGVIFADVKLQQTDEARRLRLLGLSVSIPHSTARTPQLNQPCVAWDGCRCRIYVERPKYCRQFECLLLKSVKAGQTQPAVALRKIKLARERAENVRVLLRSLGEEEEHVALSVRFRRVAKQMQRGNLAPKSGTAYAYGKLTLAVQSLNVLLSVRFYPGTMGRDACDA